MKPWQKSTYVSEEKTEEEKQEVIRGEVKIEPKIEKEEKPEKRYICELCGASFSYPHQLRNHTLGHLRQEERRAEAKLKLLREQMKNIS